MVEKTDGADADSKEVAELVNGTGDQVQSNSGVLHATTEGIPTTVPSPANESAVDALVGGGVAAVAELERGWETIIAVSEAGAQSSLPGRNAVLVKENGMVAAASGGKDSQVLAVPSESSFDPRPLSATIVQSTVERVIEQDGAGSADEKVPIPLSPLAVATGDVTRVDQERAGDPEPAAEYAGVSGSDARKTIYRSDNAMGLHAAVGADAEAEGSVTARANETLAAHQPYEHLATAEMRDVIEWESAPTEEEWRGGAVVPPVTFSPMGHDKQAQVIITRRSQRLVCVVDVAVGVENEVFVLAYHRNGIHVTNGCQRWLLVLHRSRHAGTVDIPAVCALTKLLLFAFAGTVGCKRRC